MFSLTWSATGNPNSKRSDRSAPDPISGSTGDRDVEELLLIRKLLYEENFTINGARKQLRKIRGEERLTVRRWPWGRKSFLRR